MVARNFSRLFITCICILTPNFNKNIKNPDKIFHHKLFSDVIFLSCLQPYYFQNVYIVRVFSNMNDNLVSESMQFSFRVNSRSGVKRGWGELGEIDSYNDKTSP